MSDAATHEEAMEAQVQELHHNGRGSARNYMYAGKRIAQFMKTREMTEHAKEVWSNARKSSSWRLNCARLS